MSQIATCWCGNARLVRFSDDYQRCESCETLVTAAPPAQPDPNVTNDDADFYGRNYWFKYQEQDLGYANIITRARSDLTERCLHWLRTVLRYKLPPAKTLEMGSAHGGFVAMLRAAGFDSQGLELSPAIVEYAERTFGICTLQGPIEQQQTPQKSLDLIAMMDVMEHLPDPVTTMSRCAQLLKRDGIVVIQTPHYVPGKTYEQMVETNDPFLEQLKPGEHLFLFSEKSAAALLNRAGLAYMKVEPAMFERYDMFLVAGASPLPTRDDAELENALLASGQGRIILSWLDLDRNCRQLHDTISSIEVDRAMRLEQIQRLTAQVRELQSNITEIELDREKRLDVIQSLAAQLKQLNHSPQMEVPDLLKLPESTAPESSKIQTSVKTAVYAEEDKAI